MAEINKYPKGIPSTKVEPDDYENFDEIFQHLPQAKSHHGFVFGQYQGIWFDAHLFQSVLSVHKNFLAKDTDIILATLPKSGTTWLKALTYSIINRDSLSGDQNLLLSFNPHQLIPFLENYQFKGDENVPEIHGVVGPRILSTHIAYQCLPNSILDSKCRIIYLCRNPLDVFTSTMAFVLENGFAKINSIDEEFQLFYDGIQSGGPFWEHLLGYWNQSLKTEADQKVLFLRFEDLKEDINSAVKKMAEFLGYPFSAEEEENGFIEKIARFCSFEILKNLEVNREGDTQTFAVKVKNSSFFRKGEIGDWKNYLTPSMATRLEKLMEEKFAGTGLTMEMHAEKATNA